MSYHNKKELKLKKVKLFSSNMRLMKGNKNNLLPKNTKCINKEIKLTYPFVNIKIYPLEISLVMEKSLYWNHSNLTQFHFKM